MVDVGIFGCSFTAGSFPDAWPYFFAKKHADKFTVFDYSVPGSSIEYSIYRLKQFKLKYPHAKTIFQITTPNRITKIIGEDKEDSIFDTYKKIAPKWSEMEVRTMGDVNVRKDKITKHIANTLKFQDMWALQVTWDNALYYVEQNADFAFTHKSADWYRNFKFPCVQDICGKKKFNKFCRAFPYDIHFKRDGAVWEADWVYEQVKSWN